MSTPTQAAPARRAEIAERFDGWLTQNSGYAPSFINPDERKFALMAYTAGYEAALAAREGYVLVPVEPTEGMWRALWPLWHPHEGRTPLERRPHAYEQMKDEVGALYRAMIAARPTPADSGEGK